MFRRTPHSAFFLAWFGVLVAACAQQSGLTGEQMREIANFRAAQTELLRGPQSALGMIALNKLEDGDTSVGSAPGNGIVLEHAAPHVGTVRVHGESISFVPQGSFPGDFTIGGKAASAGPVTFDPDGTSPVFVEGSVNFVLRHKFGFFLVGRDTHAPACSPFTAFVGIPPTRTTASWRSGSPGRSHARCTSTTSLGR